MEYISIKEAASIWKLSACRIQALCVEDKIHGAIHSDGEWAIPVGTKKPNNYKIKSEKNIKNKCHDKATPILKWAGGKTQLLPEILPRMPKQYTKYMEPFVGGGALFFRLGDVGSVISDSNPELINLYNQIANSCDSVIEALRNYQNDEAMFYEVRAKDWILCDPIEAAARMIYLNHTCFNGLYRLNKKGMFNTPYGRYKNPTICNEEKLHVASKILKKSLIVCGDYLDVLKTYAKEGDFIFLDPPYVPVSTYADFKRYTKEQFYEQDQINLANEVERLVNIGCKVMLTNSNHSLVHDLYKKYKIEIIPTKRNINRRGDKRKGEDVIVTTYVN